MWHGLYEYKKTLFAVTVAVLLGGLFYWFQSGEHALRSKFPDLSGTLYLSLQQQSSEGNGRMSAAFLNFPNRNILFLADPDGSSVIKHPRFANDTSIVFTMFMIPSATSTALGARIGTYNFNTKKTSYLTNLSENVYRINPSWSPSLQGVIFTVSTTTPQPQKPSVSEIHFADAKGERFLTNGLYPQFLPDGKHYVALKDDGLYLMSIDSDVSQNIFAGKNISSNRTFDISSDGSQIALASPDKGKIFILTLHQGTAAASTTVSKVISAHALWPIFSPDSRYIAAAEADWPSFFNRTIHNHRLSVFSVETGDSETIAKLDGFRKDNIILSDWISKK